MARRTLNRHRLTGATRYARTSAEGGGGQGGQGGNNNGGQQGGQDGGQGGAGSSSSSDDGPRYTQADIDRLIGERLARERTAAEQRQQAAARTEAQRLADLERELETERTARRRTKVAAKHGLTDFEDLLGTGTDEELEATAKRLKDGGLGLAKGGGTTRTGGRGTRTQTRTVTEGAGPALSAKQQAVQALRSLRSGGTSADD